MNEDAEQQPAVSQQLQTRLRNLHDRSHRTIWVGAGVLGLIALTTGDVSADIFSCNPPALRGLVLTLTVLSGTLLAYARVNFDWAISQIEHLCETDEQVDKTTMIHTLEEIILDEKKRPKWPSWANAAWLASLPCIVFAGLVFLLTLWIPVFSQCKV
jgi:hypothetical protein